MLIKFKQNVNNGGSTGGSGKEYYVLLGQHVASYNGKHSLLDVSNASYTIPEDITQYIVNIKINPETMEMTPKSIIQKTDENVSVFKMSGLGDNTTGLATVSVGNVNMDTFEYNLVAIKLDDYLAYSNSMFISGLAWPAYNADGEVYRLKISNHIGALFTSENMSFGFIVNNNGHNGVNIMHGQAEMAITGIVVVE